MEVRKSRGSAERLEAAAANLVLDAVTVEVVSALREAGKRCILLKGASTARWLYADTSRSYSDVDLLVDPAQFDDCERLLAERGFARSPVELAFPSERPDHAATWSRGLASVDLHRAVVGIGSPPREAWRVLSNLTEVWELQGSEIEVLRAEVRALLLALHAAHQGLQFEQPLEDLARALRQLPPAMWDRVSLLADRLDARAALGSGLSLCTEGVELAARFGLLDEAEPSAPGSPAFHAVQGVVWLLNTPGLSGKATFLRRKLFPPAALMRRRTTLASRHRRGLVAAYAGRLLWLARHTSTIAGGWRRVRKERARARREP